MQLIARPTASAVLLAGLSACVDTTPRTNTPPGPPVDAGMSYPDALVQMMADMGVLNPPDAAAQDAAAAPDAEEPDAGMAALCPPQAPFGSRAGQHLPVATLVDCDGNEFSLQGMCDKKASWIFTFAGW